MLPIMNINGRSLAFGGLISDASLLDILTVTNRDPANGNGVGFRAGTVVVIDAVVGDNYRGFTPTAMDQVTGKACGVAVFSHYELDQFANSNIELNGVYHQRPCNVATTCRAWVFADVTGITPNAKVGVGVFKVDGTNDLGGVVKLATDSAIPGWFFTGRVEKDANGFDVAEVHVRPQTNFVATPEPEPEPDPDNGGEG